MGSQPQARCATEGAGGIVPPISCSARLVTTSLAGVGVRDSATARPIVAVISNSSLTASLRKPFPCATIRRRCRHPSMARTPRATTFATTSRPYEEPKTSPQPTSRTDALATPEIRHHGDGPERQNRVPRDRVGKALAAVQRDPAESGETTDPDADADDVQEEARRREVVRPGRSGVASQRHREQRGQCHAEPDRERPDADGPSTGQGDHRGDERLHEQGPAERRVERQRREKGERQIGERPGEHVADRQHEHRQARDRPDDRPARCKSDGRDGQPLDHVLARRQQEHRDEQESGDSDSRQLGQERRRRQCPAHEQTRVGNAGRARLRRATADLERRDHDDEPDRETGQGEPRRTGHWRRCRVKGARMTPIASTATARARTRIVPLCRSTNGSVGGASCWVTARPDVVVKVNVPETG